MRRVAGLARAAGRSRNPQAARDALVSAGARVFARDGYFATNSNLIAKEAGYAPASFYTHFADKLDLFLAVYADWVRSEWEAIRHISLKGPRKQALESIVDVLIALHKNSVTFRGSLRALDALEPKVRAARKEQRLAQLAWMAEIVRASGAKPESHRKRVVALLAMERLLDALADGDVEALSVGEAELRRELVILLEFLLFA
jgi:AcrR family transcriptional regulator